MSNGSQIRILATIALAGVGVMVARAAYAAPSLESFLTSAGLPILMLGGMVAILLSASRGK